MTSGDYAYTCSQCHNKQYALIVSKDPKLCAVCFELSKDPNYPYTVEKLR